MRLSETRDMEGTKAFFAQALELHEESPEKVATDGLASYPRAIEEELGAVESNAVLAGHCHGASAPSLVSSIARDDCSCSTP